MADADNLWESLLDLLEKHPNPKDAKRLRSRVIASAASL